MLKLVVLVSGGGTNLQAILDAIDSGKITNAKVEVVISNNPGSATIKMPMPCKEQRIITLQLHVSHRKILQTGQHLTRHFWRKSSPASRISLFWQDV